MRLCNIKLSGFKSFVDPTNLIIPGSLVGVVGPNGCGKSNIIDAVTWVMGESSAKHLRGDSLTDVIFGGSSARQPVGQASVELVFDNSEKKLGGQYASYNEISIKRQINRDAISTYYLNGTRCRRRDITAIFLGTGLGPRSYAIIEQGMISRLIEAKPEELRVFIEEAAGISKYRERRRETENRIRHTRENVERLDDIREELEKQLNHLQRQAKAAERYKTMKTKERQLSAELLALNWRDLNKEMNALKEKAAKRENVVESSVAKVREIEANIEKNREDLSEANEHSNQTQLDYYQVGSEISQREQALQHIREKITATESELKKISHECAETQQQHDQDKKELEKLQQELSNLEPSLQGSRSESNRAHEFLNQAEEAMQSCQTERDKFNESFSEAARREQIDRTQLEHLEFSVDDLSERRNQLQNEISNFEQSDLDGKIKSLNSKLEEEVSAQTLLNNSLNDSQSVVKQHREKVRELTSSLARERQTYQELKGRLVSLETLQQSVLDDNVELTQWLSDNDLVNKQRLSQIIRIESRWMHALETVTQQHLYDYCVDDLGSYLANLETVPGSFGLVNASSNNSSATNIKNFPRLVDKITTDIKVPFILERIYLADSLGDAISMLDKLSVGESVVTEKGVWLSPDWVLINSAVESEDGLLSREAKISAIKQEISGQTKLISEIESELNQTENTLEETEVLLNEKQSELSAKQQAISDIRANLASLNTESEQHTIRNEQYTEELELNLEQSESDSDEIASIRQRLQQYETEKAKLVQQRDEFALITEKHRQSLSTARERWQQTHNESHGIALQLESFRSRRASYEQAIRRTEAQITSLDSRKTELEKLLTETSQPIAEIQQQIETCLNTKQHVEKNLGESRVRVQGIDTALRESEQNRHKQEQESQTLRADLEEVRLDINSCQVRLKAIEEQLTVVNQNAEQLLSNLEEGASNAGWEEQLESVKRKIQRLGPINLAAINEYSQGAERKTYLDSQHEDLMEALTTLENAIKKIDKETRTRFKETFDKLNGNVKEMFPKLFGGGHAYLELTGDDLLQTGVAIMARPPGKKNSNIHLLSGGEKALAAIALVFSIFKLNPAPFCILDEVDAPLDDTNVGRFNQLVKFMSDEVQFIFITHNKITMTIANQLLGVTMHEPGVSRLVSVDMDEAVEMAATA